MRCIRLVCPTFVFLCLFIDLMKYHRVGYDDDDQRKHVDSGEVEDIVGELVSVTREKVERDTLGKFGIVRMRLDVENHTL